MDSSKKTKKRKSGAGTGSGPKKPHRSSKSCEATLDADRDEESRAGKEIENEDSEDKEEPLKSFNPTDNEIANIRKHSADSQETIDVEHVIDEGKEILRVWDQPQQRNDLLSKTYILLFCSTSILRRNKKENWQNTLHAETNVLQTLLRTNGSREK